MTPSIEQRKPAPSSLLVPLSDIAKLPEEKKAILRRYFEMEAGEGVFVLDCAESRRALGMEVERG